VEWGVVETAPKLLALGGERRREHVVTPEEETAYLAEASEPLHSIATALADTGMRPEVCFRLGWENVRFASGQNGALLVTRGKTAACRRVIPMMPRVRAMIEARWIAAGQPREGWVWPAPHAASGHVVPSSIYEPHLSAVTKSKVRPFVLYDLRHTFLTRLGESGIDAWTLVRVAGHSNVALSGRYVHPSEDAILNAVSRLGGHNDGHSAQNQISQNDQNLL
jgi:integrase